MEVEKMNHQKVGKQVYPLGKSTSDHRTPKKLFENLGNFDLDVASSHENALCERYYTKETDGLTNLWIAKKVWCNPPYNNIKSWLEKGILELKEGNCEEITYLLPARTCTKWFKLAYSNAYKIQFIHGRLNFTGPNMNLKNQANAPFPSVLISLNYNYSNKNKIIELVNREGFKIL
jgi:site-specific DNA-methyltransferase (adenine-specific)